MLFLGVSASWAGDCTSAITTVERAMQDGVSDLAAARGLRNEAIDAMGSDTGPESTACRFIRNSESRYRLARDRYAVCVETLEQALTLCTDPDWSVLSASPELCETLMSEIETRLSSLPATVDRACGG